MSYLAILVLSTFIITSLALFWFVKFDKSEITAVQEKWTRAVLCIWLGDISITVCAGFYWLICQIVKVNAFSWSF